MRPSSPVNACGQPVIISTPNIAECGQVGSGQVKSEAGGARGQIFGKLKIGVRMASAGWKKTEWWMRQRRLLLQCSGQQMPNSTESYFHDFVFVFVCCFITNIKAANMKKTAGKSANGVVDAATAPVAALLRATDGGKDLAGN